MKVSIVLAPILPALAAAQADQNPGETGRLPYLWIWILASIVLLAVLGWLLFGPSTRERARAHATHRARRELHGD